MSKERLPNKRVLFRCMACDKNWTQDVCSNWQGQDLTFLAAPHRCNPPFYPAIIVAEQADLIRGEVIQMVHGTITGVEP